MAHCQKRGDAKRWHCYAALGYRNAGLMARLAWHVVGQPAGAQDVAVTIWAIAKLQPSPAAAKGKQDRIKWDWATETRQPQQRFALHGNKMRV